MTQLNFAQKEYDFMKRLGHHVQIQSCDDYFEDSHYIIQVQPLMKTNMQSHLQKLPRLLFENEAREVFQQMVRAVIRCHEDCVLHRDIKLENFLIDFDSKGKIQVKLTDFGLACNYDSNNPPNTEVGTIPYVAPEVLPTKHGRKRAYDKKVDCWSLGIILHELFSNRNPFYSDYPQLFLLNITHQPLDLNEIQGWPDVSS